MQALRVSKKVMGGAILSLMMLGPTASAQTERPPHSVSVQGTGLFTSETESNGTVQDATNSGGFLVGYGYDFNEWAGVETNYGYSRNTQNYAAGGALTGVQADFHQFTGAFVARFPTGGRLRPYTLAGGGALVFDPTDHVTITGADRQARPAFLYGGGVEVDLIPSIGLRGEYRGFVYESPDFGIQALDLDGVTHMAQPSFGFYFRF